MNAEKFWSAWLRVVMILVILGGLFLIIPNNLGTAYIDKKIDSIFSSGHAPGVDIMRMRAWLIGVMGAVMAAWGLCMLFILNNAFKKKEKWAWRGIFYPVLLWYVCDSAISAHYGAGFNVVLNTIFFLQLAAPLLFLRNLFFDHPSD